MLNKYSLIVGMLFIYHISLDAINVGQFWQKNELEHIAREIPVAAQSKITLYNTEGSFIIKPWDKQKISLEATKKGLAAENKATSITSSVAQNSVSIATNVKGESKGSIVQYTLMVPEDASLTIIQTKGPVTVKGINANVDISLEEGPITIEDGTQSVTAKTGNGTIHVQQKKLGSNHSIFLQTHKGNITVALPRQTHALLHAKTSNGTITSDHPVSISATIKLNKENWERIKKEIDGSLGNATEEQDMLPPVTLETTKGSIIIKEY